MERYTSCKVELELYDVTAMSDSKFIASNTQSFSDISSIKNTSEIVRIATCEDDYFLLDGSYQMYDDVTNLKNKIGYMSSEYSSTIQSTFASNHSSVGITFYFYETLPDKIMLHFTNGNSFVAKETFYPTLLDCEINKKDGYTEYVYFASIGAEDYNKMVIELTSANRFIRLNHIEYGVKLIYGDDYKRKVKSCTLTEEVDITSSELPINECKLELVDDEKLFEITNPKSYYKYLQKRQRFKVYEKIDDTEKLMANHYLKEWTQTKSMLASFTLQDVIGLMSTTTFYGGMYSNVTTKNLIGIVMNDFGFADYTIDEDIQDIVLTGYIGIKTHREALQQIAFACGACIDTSRSSGINIYKQVFDTVFTIGKDKKLISTAHEITQKDLVTGVSMTTHLYELETETSEAYKGTLEAGTHKVTFSDPYSNLSITGGTITASNCNYADITVSDDGEVVITGYKYVDNTAERIYKLSELPSATDECITTITDATLVSKSNVDTLTKYMYYVKQFRLEHTVLLILENEQVSDMVAIRTNDCYVPLLITKMETDLTGGFTSKVEGIGYALKMNEYYRTGTELYAGSEGII